MKRNDPYPGDWLCWSCEFYGSGWVYFELQEDARGTFDLVNCPNCHIAVIPRQLTQSSRAGWQTITERSSHEQRRCTTRRMAL